MEPKQKVSSLPSPFHKIGFQVPNVLTEEQCNNLIARIQNPEKIDTKNSAIPVGDAERVVERTALKDPDLASWLFQILSPICPSTWSQTEEDEHMGPFSQGEWVIDGIDHRIQLYRYESGGIFSKHRDGPTYQSVDLRSLFTVLIYLNSGYTGGHTTVFADDLSQSHKVEPGLGACFIMLQRTLHEGSQVQSGLKYALRCDVLYRRSSGTAEEIVKHLDRTEQAKKWFRLASCLELSGCTSGSVPYYQRAYKLDPSVDAEP